MMTDADLQLEVRDELRWEPRVTAARIGVSVKDGVALAGPPVAAEPARLAAVCLNCHTPGTVAAVLPGADAIGLVPFGRGSMAAGPRAADRTDNRAIRDVQDAGESLRDAWGALTPEERAQVPGVPS